MFSVYTNLLIPGNTIKLHVDTPDFAGLDRSRCPSWLLAVAHCSGLFTEDRIRNVTCVCYPRDANGGELSLHAAQQTGEPRLSDGRNMTDCDCVRLCLPRQERNCRRPERRLNLPPSGESEAMRD